MSKQFNSFFPSVRLVALAVFGLFYVLPALAADLPLAQGSPLAGFSFDDQPLMLPVQQNFQMALLTSSTELGRSCGKMEAYGWRMKQNEQQRVDQIFNATVDRLRALGYSVETEAPNSVSKDVTLFTADRPDKHFMFMWSAGEIGLVMVLCQSTPPSINRNATASYYGQMPAVHSFPMPGDVVQSELKTPVRDKTTKEASIHFSPVGKWVGTYSCMQGFTGGTLDISSLNGKTFKGTFRFYPTPKNPQVTSGSYNVFGQYDHATHRILVNPGKWIKHPKGYANTIIVGDFDPSAHSFSGFFQGISGCTSFEAKLSGASHELGNATKKKAKKKKTAAKKAEPAPDALAPANAPIAPPPVATGGPPSPGIPVGSKPPAPAALGLPPAPQPAPALQLPQPTQMPQPPAAAPAPAAPTAMPPGQ